MGTRHVLSGTLRRGRLTIGALTMALTLVAVAAAPANAAPETVIEQGPAGTTSERDAVFAFSSDEWANFRCQLDDERPTPCLSPMSYEGLAAGEHTFEVRAESVRHPTVDPTPATRTWTVDPDSASQSYQGVAPAGGAVSSDPAGDGASAGDPLTTDVTVPAGGSVSITEQPASTPAPDGFTVFGHEAQIAAPAASAAEPLRLVFTLDASAMPADADPEAVTVLRDGAPAADCAGTAAAEPDPCVADRQVLAGGDLRLTVLTSHASTWSFAEARDSGGSAPPPGDPLGLQGVLDGVLGLLGELGLGVPR